MTAAHIPEKDAQGPLYVLPDRWDHAMSAANQVARRDGVRYQVRWFQPRGCWVVTRTRVIPPAKRP